MATYTFDDLNPAGISSRISNKRLTDHDAVTIKFQSTVLILIMSNN